MNTMEQNRQVVQDGLNKRKAARQIALYDAEQEAITIQIINIVNNNACRAKNKANKSWSALTYDDDQAWAEFCTKPLMPMSYRRNRKQIWLDRLLMAAFGAATAITILFAAIYLA